MIKLYDELHPELEIFNITTTAMIAAMALYITLHAIAAVF